jgi:hypothetical protein
MYGSVSKWSISYFAAGLFWLLAAEWLMTAGFGFPAAALRSPDTLVLVHIVCIGWLSMTMCGALFQFVPVLVARPLHAERWTLLAFVLLSAGLIALLCGFLVLGGRLRGSVLLLPAGATLLATGVSLVAANIGMTLWHARPLVGPARFVAVGFVCICITAAFGGIFAFVLAGVTVYPVLSNLLQSAVPIHAIAGLGGWLTLTAMGVSYRLLAMFMLAPDIDDAQSRAGLLAGAAGVTVAVLVGTAMIMSSGQLGIVLLLAALFGLAALAFYGRDVMTLYRSRKRRDLELHTHMAAWSFVSLAAAALLGTALVAMGSFTRHVGAFAFLTAFGWLSGLILAMLYKIVAFLTWLEAYGPVMGRTMTPRVQDLVDEGRARKWFVLFFAAVWGATLALLCETPLPFRALAAVMTISTVGIVAELARARRLADVAAAIRVPAGVSVPRLLLSRNSE